jgi:hypothetical protein
VRYGRQAIEEMKALDAYDTPFMQYEYGRILVLAGRNDEALAVLGVITAGPGDYVPKSYPYDPVWGRLKGDPRFQSILDSSKPL